MNRDTTRGAIEDQQRIMVQQGEQLKISNES
jgi:hypothetical protein